jgi:hypothetical protein
MERRGFLRGILAAGMAPAVVKAELLMPVRKIFVPTFAAATMDDMIRLKMLELKRDIEHSLFYGNDYLASVIYRISPQETPFTAMARREGVGLHSWTTEVLR